jgi:hypothetical protein
MSDDSFLAAALFASTSRDIRVTATEARPPTRTGEEARRLMREMATAARAGDAARTGRVGSKAGSGSLSAALLVQPMVAERVMQGR